jgi:putative ABC transport system permease protein
MRRVLRGQVIIVSAAGALLGHVIAIPTRQSIFGAIMESIPLTGFVIKKDTLPVLDLSLFGVAGMALAVSAVATIAARRGISRALKTPPLRILREPEETSLRMSWGRWIAVAVLAAATITSIVTIPAMERDNQSGWIFVPLLLTSLLALIGPVMLPVIVKAWTLLVPENKLPAWHLARRAALHRLTSSTASITPIMTVTGLTAGLYTAISVLTSVYNDTIEEAFPLGVAILFLGGPALITGVGSSVAVLIAGRVRTRQVALLTTVGATRWMTLRTAFAEAMIYSITAGIVALLIAVATGAIVAIGVSGTTPEAEFRLELNAAILILASATVLLLASSLGPVLRGLRQRPAVVLGSGQ